METSEQIVVAGHPLSGTVWLGAPVAVALAVHAVACVLSACALSHTLLALTRTAVTIALFVRAVFMRRRSAGARAPRFRLEPPAETRANPLASRAGKRAPPLVFG